MSHLWDIAQAHLDAYGVRAAALARRMGTSPQTLDSWKNRGLTRLPDRQLLEALARETNTPYAVVLNAVLRDINYADEERTTDEQATPTKVPPQDQDALKRDLRGLTPGRIADALSGRAQAPPDEPGDNPHKTRNRTSR